MKPRFTTLCSVVRATLILAAGGVWSAAMTTAEGSESDDLDLTCVAVTRDLRRWPTSAPVGV
jgi:hypothetical protein